MAKRKKTQAGVKEAMKKAIRGGLKHIQRQREELEGRQRSLLDEVQEVEKAIAELDRQLQAAVRESLRELRIRPLGPVKQASRSGGGTIGAWILGLLAAKGPLQTGQINQQAGADGLNVRSVGMTLSKMAREGQIKAKGGRGRQGKLYSAK